MIKNVVLLSNKLSVNPVVSRATGSPYGSSPNTLAHKNPILHQSNRIVTVGLLSSYGLLQNASRSNPHQVHNPTKSASLTGQLHPQLNFISPKSLEGRKSSFNFKFDTQEKVVEIEASALKEENTIEMEMEPIENKISVSIYLGEFAKVLTVLTTNEPEVTITRTPDENKNTSLDPIDQSKLSFVLKRPTDEIPSFLLQLSKHNICLDLDEETASSVSYRMNNSEAVLLTEFMRNSIRSGLGFTD